MCHSLLYLAGAKKIPNSDNLLQILLVDYAWFVPVTTQHKIQIIFFLSENHYPRWFRYPDW